MGILANSTYIDLAKCRVNPAAVPIHLEIAGLLPWPAASYKFGAPRGKCREMEIAKVEAAPKKDGDVRL